VQRAVIVGLVTNVKRRQRGKDCAGKRGSVKGEKEGDMFWGGRGEGWGMQSGQRTHNHPPVGERLLAWADLRRL